MPHFLRIGTLIVAAQATVALLGVVALRVYTGLAPAAVFGASSLILSALGLGAQMFVAGFTAVQLRYYSKAQALGAAEALARDTLVMSLCASTVLTICAIVVWLLLRAVGHPVYGWPVVAGAAGWLYAMTVRNVLLTRIQAERRQATYAGLQVVEAALLLAATAVALWFSASVESYLLGQAAAVLAFLLVIVTVDRRALAALRLWAPSKSPFPRTVWRYGLPFAPLAFLGWLANLGDRYTVAAMLGAASAGRYVAPFSIASRAAVLMNTSLCDLFRPLLFDAANRADSREIRHIFWRWVMASAALGGAALLCVLLGGGLIARLMLAPAYRSGATDIMLWVVAGYAVSGVTQIFENRILSLGYSGRLLGPMIVGAVANVGFSVALVLSNGVLGAAQATCMSFVIQSLVTLLVLRRTQLRGQNLAMKKEGELDVA